MLSRHHYVSASLLDRITPADSLSPWAGGQTQQEFVRFQVRLIKDPRYGLGLTLVDGEIQGIKGVYIKSLTGGGPAELHGRLKMGMFYWGDFIMESF